MTKWSKPKWFPRCYYCKERGIPANPLFKFGTHFLCEICIKSRPALVKQMKEKGGISVLPPK